MPKSLPLLLGILATLSLVLSGAIFGFFYAWICSTMWGLDAIDPRIAIAAMQGMNASVRNIVFAPAFFGTPFVLLATAAVCWINAYRSAGMGFALGGVVYLFAGMLLTISVNVPMNEALGQLAVPDEIAAAQAIWDDYSPRWQVWNITRTIASGVSLLAVGWGIFALGRAERRPSNV